jgi:hypothetical protein
MHWVRLDRAVDGGIAGITIGSSASVPPGIFRHYLLACCSAEPLGYVVLAGA